jgi:antitoxin YefM
MARPQSEGPGPTECLAPKAGTRAPRSRTSERCSVVVIPAYLIAASSFAGWHPGEEVAILLAMSVSEQMPLADVKNRLSEVVDRLEREHGRIVITKHGRPAAVVISVDDLESLEETLDIMSNDAVLAQIRESLTELSTANAGVLSKEDALRLISGQ